MISKSASVAFAAPTNEDDVSSIYIGACAILRLHPNQHVLTALSRQARHAAGEKGRVEITRALGRNRAKRKPLGVSVYRSPQSSAASGTVQQLNSGIDYTAVDAVERARSSSPRPRVFHLSVPEIGYGGAVAAAVSARPSSAGAAAMVRLMPHSQVVCRSSATGRVVSAPAPAFDLSHTYCGGKGLLPLMPVFLTPWFDTLRTLNFASTGLYDESIKELAHCLADGKHVSSSSKSAATSAAATIRSGGSSSNRRSPVQGTFGSAAAAAAPTPTGRGAGSLTSGAGIGSIAYSGGGNSRHIVALILDDNNISMAAADDLKRLRRSIAPTAFFSVENNPALVPSLVSGLATAKYAYSASIQHMSAAGAAQAAAAAAAAAASSGGSFGHDEALLGGSFVGSFGAGAVLHPTAIGAGLVMPFNNNNNNNSQPSSPTQFLQLPQRRSPLTLEPAGSYFAPSLMSNNNNKLSNHNGGGAGDNSPTTADLLPLGHKTALAEMEAVRRRLLRHRHLVTRRTQQLSVLSFAIENPGARWFPMPARPFGGWLTLGCLFSLPPVACSIERAVCISAVRRVNICLRPYQVCLVPVFLDHYHANKLAQQQQAARRHGAGSHRKSTTPLHQQHTFPSSQHDPTVNAFLQLGVNIVVVFATEHAASYQLEHWMFGESNSIFGQRRNASSVVVPMLYRRTTAEMPRVFRACPAQAHVLRQIIDRANNHFSAFGAACFALQYRAEYRSVTRDGEIEYAITQTTARSEKPPTTAAAAASMNTSKVTGAEKDDEQAELDALDKAQSPAEAQAQLEKVLCSDLLAAAGKIRELIVRRMDCRTLDPAHKTMLPRRLQLRQQHEKETQERISVEQYFSPKKAAAAAAAASLLLLSRPAAPSSLDEDADLNADSEPPRPFAAYHPGPARVMLQELLGGFVHVVFLPDDPAALAEMKLAAREFHGGVDIASVQCRGIVPRSKWNLQECIWTAVGLPSSSSPCSGGSRGRNNSMSSAAAAAAHPSVRRVSLQQTRRNSFTLSSVAQPLPFSRPQLDEQRQQQQQQLVSPQQKADTLFAHELAQLMKSSTTSRCLVLWDLDSVEGSTIAEMATFVTLLVKAFKPHGLRIVVLMDASSAKHRRVWQETSTAMGTALQILDQSRSSDSIVEKIFSAATASSTSSSSPLPPPIRSRIIDPQLVAAITSIRCVALARVVAHHPTSLSVSSPSVSSSLSSGDAEALAQTFFRNHIQQLLKRGSELSLNSGNRKQHINTSPITAALSQRMAAFDASVKTVSKFFECILVHPQIGAHRVGMPLALIKFGQIRVAALRRVRPREQSLLADALLTPVVVAAPEDDTVLLHYLSELHDELDWSPMLDYGIWNAPLHLASASLERLATSEVSSCPLVPDAVLQTAAARDAARAVDAGTYPLTLHFMAMMTPADLNSQHASFLSEVGIMRAARSAKMNLLLHLLDDWKAGANGVAAHQHSIETDGGLAGCRMCSYLELIGIYKSLVQNRSQHLLTTFVELDATNMFFADRRSALGGRSAGFCFIPHTLTPCRIFASRAEAATTSGAAASASVSVSGSFSPVATGDCDGEKLPSSQQDQQHRRAADEGQTPPSAPLPSSSSSLSSSSSSSSFEFFSSTTSVYCFLRIASRRNAPRRSVSVSSTFFGGGGEDKLFDRPFGETPDAGKPCGTGEDHDDDEQAAENGGRNNIVEQGELAMFPALLATPASRLRTHSHPISDARVIDEPMRDGRKLNRICVASCTELLIVVVLADCETGKMVVKYRYDSSVKMSRGVGAAQSAAAKRRGPFSSSAAEAAAAEAAAAASSASASSAMSIPVRLSAVALGRNDGGAGTVMILPDDEGEKSDAANSSSSSLSSSMLVPPLLFAGADSSLAGCSFSLVNEAQTWHSFPSVTRRVIFISFLDADVTAVTVDHVGTVLVWGACDSPAPGLVLCSVTLSAAPLRVLPHLQSEGVTNEIVIAMPTVVLVLGVGRSECRVVEELALPRGFKGTAAGGDGPILICDDMNDAVVVELDVPEEQHELLRKQHRQEGDMRHQDSSNRRRNSRGGGSVNSGDDDSDSSTDESNRSRQFVTRQRILTFVDDDGEECEEYEEYEEEEEDDDEEHEKRRLEKQRRKEEERKRRASIAAAPPILGKRAAVVRQRFSPLRCVGASGGTSNMLSSQSRGGGKMSAAAASSALMMFDPKKDGGSGGRVRCVSFTDGLAIFQVDSSFSIVDLTSRVSAQLRVFNNFSFAEPQPSDSCHTLAGGCVCFTSKSSVMWWRVVAGE